MMTILPQTHPKFICDKYLFISHNTKDYNRHLLRRKHLNDDKMVTSSPQLTPLHLC